MCFQITQVLAKVFLIASLLLFTAFHFLHGFGSDRLGWIVWKDIGEVLLQPSVFTNPWLGIVVASFLTSSLLIVASPFLRSVWIKSRMAWWLALVFGGLAAVGFAAMVLRQNSVAYLGPGGWCLTLAPLVNFCGLLLVRKNLPHGRFLQTIKSFKASI